MGFCKWTDGSTNGLVTLQFIKRDNTAQDLKLWPGHNYNVIVKVRQTSPPMIVTLENTERDNTAKSSGFLTFLKWQTCQAKPNFANTIPIILNHCPIMHCGGQAVTSEGKNL